MPSDYVVVGAGSAGCAVAGRLAEDGRSTVLLLEAGRSDRSPVIQVPAATYLYAIANPRWDWCHVSEPDPTRGGRSEIWPRGKVLGGTSSINGMIYIRGQREDFDAWAGEGNAGWGYADVLPYFRRAEANERGASAFHGDDGPLTVSDLRVKHSLADAFVAAAIETGIPANDDFNGARQEGVGLLQATQRRGRRCSSARAYLSRPRPNLAIVTHAHATRIVVRDGRAAAVEYVRGGRTKWVEAAREIVVSAGAIGSPHLLMLSGIGPGDALGRAGISVVHELPGVGRNLTEHTGSWLCYEVRRRTYNMDTGLAHKLAYGVQWLLLGRGPAATPDAQALAFIRTAPDLDRPDVQIHFTPAGFELRPGGPVMLERPAVSGLVNVCRPRSRGHVTPRSPDPLAPPAILPNLLADPDDLRRLVAGSRLARRIHQAPSFAPEVVAELAPGPRVQSDDEWEDYLRRTATPIYHPTGTCRMGRDTGAVVDDRLRVSGIGGLRIADASIMPIPVSGNTNATCIMIGEKAADLVLEDRRG